MGFTRLSYSPICLLITICWISNYVVELLFSSEEGRKRFIDFDQTEKRLENSDFSILFLFVDSGSLNQEASGLERTTCFWRPGRWGGEWLGWTWGWFLGISQQWGFVLLWVCRLLLVPIVFFRCSRFGIELDFPSPGTWRWSCKRFDSGRVLRRRCKEWLKTKERWCWWHLRSVVVRSL